MFKSTSKVIVSAAAVLIFAVGPLNGFAEETAPNNCDVPVCSISIEMERLRNLDHNARGDYAGKLVAKFEASKDVKVLKNLLEVGKSLQALNEELGDPSSNGWVIQAANKLVDTAYYGLAKYLPVNSDNLIATYKKIKGSRYSLLRFFIKKVSKIEDVATIDAIITFANAAEEISIADGDDDWIAREAKKLAVEGTNKILFLDPYHEGLYKVEVSASSLANGAFPFQKVAVLDSSSNKNLLVAFINTKYRRVVYSYSNTTIEGNHVKGTFLSNGDMANSFEFTLDRASGTIEGKITTTHKEIEFSGTQEFSTKEVFKGSVPYDITEEDILGTLTGKLAGIDGKLSVKMFKPGIYSATFRSNSGSIVLHFQGKYFPINGVLSLTSNNQIKLTVSLRETAEGVKWIGGSFSTTTGTASSAEFTPLK